MKTIVTHNSTYHADDVFAVATLLFIASDAKIIRTRDESVINSADYVVDVGAQYDPDKNRFDHHQTGGAGARGNGVPYASFGLVWKKFGETIAGGKEEFKEIDEKLVMPIDAHDNGFVVSSPTVDGMEDYKIEDFLDSFMDSHMSLEELDETFNRVVEIAKGVLEREINISKQKVKDWEEVRRAYEASEDKRLIILPSHMSWKKVLVPSQAVYIVSNRPDGKWQARAVQKSMNGYELKKPFPKEWSGTKDDDLRRLSGVDDAVFCHKSLFLVVALSKEGAIALANKALEA